jgi:hypothetical protein
MQSVSILAGGVNTIADNLIKIYSLRKIVSISSPAFNLVDSF